jgi:fermentation-respiration switch protein FrsA (DUF1100 family)
MTRYLLAGVLAVALMARFADRLVYFPSRVLDGGTLAALGLEFEDIALTTSDGVRLHAWFVPAPGTTPVVLFLHGNAGNISHRLDKLAVLNQLGAAVMLLDYRGYGRSEGTPDEDGTYRDADAAYDWLRRRPVAEQRIVVYGESLGGPIATDLAARRPVGGLILESAPSSIIGVARHHYPYLPVALFLSIRYDAAAKIGAVRTPLLILHSPTDEIVPFTMAEQLYAAANQPKQLVRLRGAHNDNFLVAAETYRAALHDFLQRGIGPAPQGTEPLEGAAPSTPGGGGG